MQRRRFTTAVSAFAASLAVPVRRPRRRAGHVPEEAVTLVVPNAPGGAIDILARLLEARLKDAWGQPIIVYKPGAGTVLGTDFVAKSPADGHTMCLVVTSHVINPSLRKNMPFDTLKDLAGVSLLATSPIAISATPALPANNLKELIELAKKNPASSPTHRRAAAARCTWRAEMLKTHGRPRHPARALQGLRPAPTPTCSPAGSRSCSTRCSRRCRTSRPAA